MSPKELFQREILTSISSKKSLIKVQPSSFIPEEFYHDISNLCMENNNYGKQPFDFTFYISKKRLDKVLSTKHYSYLKKNMIAVNHDADHLDYTDYNQYFFDRLFYLDTQKTYIVDDMIMFYESDIHLNDFKNYSHKEKQLLARFWGTYCRSLSTENFADTHLKEFIDNLGILY